MSEHGHDLHTLFPGQNAILHSLKVESEQYRVLASRYHQLAREIEGIESAVHPASDERLEELKKQRLGLLDEIADLVGERQEA